MNTKSGLLLTLALLGACSGNGEDPLVDGFTAAEVAKIKTLSPLPTLEKDTTNKFADDPKAAQLGHRFFFEKGYSGPIVTGDPVSAELAADTAAP